MHVIKRGGRVMEDMVRSKGNVKKSYRIALIISALPYIAVLAYAVYSAIHGIEHTFITSSIDYGFDGFLWALYKVLLWNGIFFPLLPICLTYQIAYVHYRKQDNKRPIWIITAIVAGALCLYVFGVMWSKFGLWSKFFS